jgi:hypothetical protein
MEHKLINDTLTRESDGIIARCVCGWTSRPHFSSMAASAEFREHLEQVTPKLGDGPIEDQYVLQMNAIAQTLDHLFNGEAKGEERKTGFVVLVFPFGEEATGRCNFISNGADRRDVVTLMKEMIKRFEGQPEIVGRA